MENQENQNQFAAQEEAVFEIGKSGKTDDKQKKKKKNENVAEDRIKEHFNLNASNKDHDELKRKREDFAVQLRKKKK